METVTCEYLVNAINGEQRGTGQRSWEGQPLRKVGHRQQWHLATGPILVGSQSW